MKPRPGAVHKGDIVHVGLAVHPGGPKLFVGRIGGGVFGTTEAQGGVVVKGALDVGDVQVEMVEAHDSCTAIQIESL
jgi:hypothetical protein